MNISESPKLLRIALIVTGIIFVAGIYPLTIVWPEGWAWHHTGQSMYLQMILGIYATLGVFLILASREPLAHRSLIWFAIWSSGIHAAIMTVQSIVYPEHRGHLYGDVPALLIVATVLALLMPRRTSAVLYRDDSRPAYSR
jgi:Na+/H+ antiporter NhaA